MRCMTSSVEVRTCIVLPHQSLLLLIVMQQLLLLVMSLTVDDRQCWVSYFLKVTCYSYCYISKVTGYFTSYYPTLVIDLY